MLLILIPSYLTPDTLIGGAGLAEAFPSHTGSENNDIRRNTVDILSPNVSSARGVAVVFPIPAPAAPRGAPHGEPLTPIPSAENAASAAADSKGATDITALHSSSGASLAAATATAAAAAATASSSTTLGISVDGVTIASAHRRNISSSTLTPGGSAGDASREVDATSMDGLMAERRAAEEGVAKAQAQAAVRAASAARAAAEASAIASRAAAAATAANAAAAARSKDSDAESGFGSGGIGSRGGVFDSGGGGGGNVSVGLADEDDSGFGPLPDLDFADRVWRARPQAQTRILSRVEMSVMSSASSQSFGREWASSDRSSNARGAGGAGGGAMRRMEDMVEVDRRSRGFEGVLALVYVAVLVRMCSCSWC